MIRYTKHALTRLEERNIARETIEELLDKPDYILKSKLGRRIAIKRIGDKYLKVVYVTEGDIIVLTALWLTRLRAKDKLYEDV